MNTGLPFSKFVALYFLSFFPLWFCCWVRCLWSNIFQNQPTWAERTVLVSLPVLFVMALSVSSISRVKGSVPDIEVTLTNIRRQKHVQLEFMVANLLPFVAFDVTKGVELSLFAFLFVFLAGICWHHYGLLWSPWLDLFGYTFYDCRIVMDSPSFNCPIRVITKRRIDGKQNQRFRLYRLDGFGLHYWDGEIENEKTR